VKPRHTVVQEASTRSPRTAWLQPRTVESCERILQLNGFHGEDFSTATILTRHCGLMALRVTIARGVARLETGVDTGRAGVRWRRSRDVTDGQPWRVTREALELLRVLEVDTPIRWG